MSSTAQVLEDAAAIIDERGWVKGNKGWGWGTDPNGPVCLEGALALALGMELDALRCYQIRDDVNASAPGKALREFLGPELRLSSHQKATLLDLGYSLDDAELQPFLYNWNDAQTDGVQVTEALRAAALIAGAREVQVFVY